MQLIILFKSSIKKKIKWGGGGTKNGDAKTKTIHESMSGGAQFERRFTG